MSRMNVVRHLFASYLHVLLLSFCISMMALPAQAAADGIVGGVRDGFVGNAASGGGAALKLILFWREGCPHCEKEMVFLEELRRQYPALDVQAFEVSKSPENARVFEAVMKKAGATRIGTPATIIGNAVFMGFSEEISRQIEQQVRALSKGNGEVRTDTVWIPFIGQVKPEDFSLPVFTIIVAGADSINPCALFVLLFLLSFLIHVRSRVRMAIVGGTFVFFSGFIYFIFMAAWLNLFMVLGSIGVITAVAGGVAMVLGGINIKDFFAFKKGVSLTMSDDASGRIIKRMRGILNASSMPSMLAGAVLLAVAANMYELLCTLGLPMVYVRVLTLNKLSALSYYLYLLFYNVVYVIPLLAVVVIFTTTLGARKLTEWQGRVLKLLSGMMMFTIGLVLAFKPELLNNFVVMIALLGGSIGLSLIVGFLMKPD